MQSSQEDFHILSRQFSRELWAFEEKKTSFFVGEKIHMHDKSNFSISSQKSINFLVEHRYSPLDHDCVSPCDSHMFAVSGWD